MDDLIRRADAIELCRKWRDKAHEAKDQDGWWMADNLLRHTKEIPSADAVSEWIPCSERMPDANGKYLCCWQGKSVETGMFLNGHFRLYGEIKDRLVTAWMPLPKLYEEVKENE